jgi:hypothetical protein
LRDKKYYWGILKNHVCIRESEFLHSLKIFSDEVLKFPIKPVLEISRIANPVDKSIGEHSGMMRVGGFSRYPLYIYIGKFTILKANK